MRYLSLDIFKATGIIYLVFLHQMIWLYSFADGNGLRFEEAGPIIYSLGYRSGLHILGLQIPLLAGVTYYLSLQKKRSTFKDIFLRGGMLIAAGYGMNLLAWGVGDMWAWDVLQFIGVSLIVSYPFLKSRAGLGVLGILSFLALSFSQQFPLSEFSNQYWYVILMGDKSGNNYWPMCPWFFLFWAGIILGKFYFEKKMSEYIFYVIGITLMVVSHLSGNFYAAANWDHIWGASIFKPSLYFVVGVAGFSLCVIPFFEKGLAQSPHLKKLLGHPVLLYLGRNIFWVYILSTIIGYHGTVVFIMLFTDMDFHQTTMVWGVFAGLNLFLCYWLVKWIDNVKGKIIEGLS